jgi:hypothetical protein
MEKEKNWGLVSLFVIASLLLGLVAGIALDNKVEYKEIKVPFPVEKIVLQNVTVEKLVEVPVANDYQELAYEAFIEEFEDDDAVPAGYDFEQLVKYKLGDSYTVKFMDEKTKITFDVELKFLDEDTQEKLYQDYNVVVVFEEGEDAKVQY